MEDLAKLIETEEGAGLYTHILSISAALPMVMKTAHELNLFELIANAGPGAYVSSVHLAAQLPTSNPHAPLLIDRILRLLSSFSILSCTGRNQPDGRSERLYGLTPAGKFLTKNNDGVSMAPLLALIHDKTLMEGWYYMSEAILKGGYPFEKAYGVDLFDYLEKNPKLRNDFNKGMSNPTTIILKKVLEIYDGFKGLRTLVDVGGGVGATLRAIVSKYPNINGINFDLPHVIKDAHFHHGVEHVGGDMFVGVPKGDAIFMKAILHDWDDDKCRLLLKNCYESLIENGKVILVEFLLPDVPDNTLEGGLAALIDVVMLAHNPGAKERTEKELRALAKDAGFIDFRKICCAYGIWIIELHK